GLIAVERIVSQLHARRVRPNEYRARCPIHQGKSDTSLSIKVARDRVLIYCHAGCGLKDILGALGLKSAAELFDGIKGKPSAKARSRARAIYGLERWCEAYLITVCNLLRDVDGAIRLGTSILQQIEDGILRRNGEPEHSAWELLGHAYK